MNEPPPKIMSELSRFLEEKGHFCVKITNDNTFEWCQKDICSNSNNINKYGIKKNSKFIDELISKRHSCFKIKEDDPFSEVEWCKQKNCINLES